MRFDMRVAAHFYVSAAFFSVCMMLAPEIFHLGETARLAIFFGGLAGAVLFGLLGFRAALYEEQTAPRIGHNRRMFAIYGMVVFGAGFIACAAWYFWPSHLEVKKPWKHSFEELYNSDFANLGNIERQFDVALKKKEQDAQAISFHLRFRLYPDFISNTDFVSVFIPMSNRADVNDKIVDLIKLLPNEIKKFREEMRNSIGIGTSAPGMSYRELKDLRFSGRVFIYTQQPFTVVQLGELTSLYQANDLSLDIRGHDYWWVNKDR